ncbi:MAG: hypothetical protein RLZZ77_1546 [Bacteroidota bacterium]
MKLKNCLLAASTAFFFLSANAQKGPEYFFEPITIMDFRENYGGFSNLTDNQKIIYSREEIALLPARNINEVLSYISGIQLGQRGPFGAQADISLLGSTFEQVAVLINGIPMRDPQTGHHTLNLPIDLNEVESIEVFKGSASRIYGANALAGAINIITRKSGSAGTELEVYGYKPIAEVDDSTANYYTGGASVNIGYERLKSGHTIGLSILESNGYRYNSANSQKRLSYSGDYYLRKGQLRVLAGMLNNAFDANGYYAAPYDIESYEQVDTYFAGAHYKVKLNSKTYLMPSVYYRYNHDDYVFIKDQPEVYQNNHYSTTAGTRIVVGRSGKIGITSVGIDSRSELIRSNNLGKHERFYNGAFVEQTFQITPHLITSAGVNVQNNSDYGTNVYPGLELGYTRDKFLFYGSVGYGNRLPTYTDLYYTDRANNGNDSLQVEEATTYTIGFTRRGEYWKFDLSGFYRQTNDFIDFVRTSDTTKYTPQNFNDVHFRGIETSLVYTPKGQIEPGLTSARISYTYLNGTVQNIEGYQSRYALSHYKHQFNMQLGFLLFGRLHSTISVRSFTFFDESILNPTPVLVDCRIKYRTQNFTFYADAMNLLNTTYAEKGTIPMPGSGVRLGIQYSQPKEQRRILKKP